MVPPVEFGSGQAQPVDELTAAVPGQQAERLDGAEHQPGRHHVGIRVVVDPGRGPVRVTGVELVRADHPTDRVPAPGRVEGREAGEEPGHLEDHLGALQRQELAITGGLVVLPGAAGDCDADVALPVGASGSERPERGSRCTSWLCSRPSLPDCHGYIARTGLPGGPAGGRQPPVPVLLQGPAQLGQPQGQDREHEHVVQKMCRVGLAVQPRAGMPTSRPMLLGETVCSRWKRAAAVSSAFTSPGCRADRSRTGPTNGPRRERAR